VSYVDREVFMFVEPVDLEIFITADEGLVDIRSVNNKWLEEFNNG
jgi:hypothetical protein